LRKLVYPVIIPCEMEFISYVRKKKAMFCSHVLGRDQAFSRGSRSQEEGGLENFELSRPGRDKMKIPSSPANS
jgi:hypothetical protein